jgi:hypothetical protein
VVAITVGLLIVLLVARVLVRGVGSTTTISETIAQESITMWTDHVLVAAVLRPEPLDLLAVAEGVAPLAIQ